MFALFVSRINSPPQPWLGRGSAHQFLMFGADPGKETSLPAIACAHSYTTVLRSDRHRIANLRGICRTSARVLCGADRSFGVTTQVPWPRSTGEDFLFLSPTYKSITQVPHFPAINRRFCRFGVGKILILLMWNPGFSMWSHKMRQKSILDSQSGSDFARVGECLYPRQRPAAPPTKPIDPFAWSRAEELAARYSKKRCSTSEHTLPFPRPNEPNWSRSSRPGLLEMNFSSSLPLS